MHILITADGRSPIAINWIRMVLDAGHMVTLVTTYPCQEIPGVEHIIPLHVAFGSLAGGGSSPSSALRRLVRRFRPLFQAARNTFAPLGMERAGRQFSRLVEQVKPDIVHALRIPYEGILASHTPPGIPLVVNIWGNDFTLHANSSRMLGRLTTGTLRRADALMADTRRDLRLAVRWGFDSTKPALALPSAGGIDLEQVGAAVSLPFRQEVFAKIPKDIPWVVNPRGIRAYTRTDVFFQSIPLVLNRWQNVRFLCPGMENRKEAEDWVQRLGIDDHVHLLPVLSQYDLWRLFSQLGDVSFHHHARWHSQYFVGSHGMWEPAHRRRLGNPAGVDYTGRQWLAGGSQSTPGGCRCDVVGFCQSAVIPNSSRNQSKYHSGTGGNPDGSGKIAEILSRNPARNR